MSPSLVLAQAAEESGWATSRFTVEGNAYFGQWDFSGKGMKPRQQRKALGNYGVAQFDTPLESVEGYLLNLNTSNAYQ
ncbi:glucosaminidase domain-containing protein [Shewanella sp. HN-41]|uniref:glucosaminidase domain-containing protein n=1 Tax=Shewanella sp. HN-41 TaxID=327275 RepID=UPI000212634B|nr:glucosaminidase domain-containing protein [Shewanella sp. HN-41]EGM71558.1 putative FlgJ-like protein [Shewanella sp. HN-41]